MKNTKRRRLDLALQSVRVLTTDQLRDAAGGERLTTGHWPTSRNTECSTQPDC